MKSSATFGSWVLALILCAIAVVLSIAYVDRPVALWLDAHVRHTEFWIGLNRALYPFLLVVIAAFLFLLGCGVWRITGGSLPTWISVPLLCSWATIWALAATDAILKPIFGRGRVDPTFVRDHLSGFHFLHGETYWDAFPSGTATVAFAILAVLWLLKPRLRAASAVLAVLLSIAVVIGNYHWLSDVIAGAFLGVTVGWSTVELHGQGSPPSIH
jgi:membrane-associated phospholipid phosphatase